MGNGWNSKSFPWCSPAFVLTGNETSVEFRGMVGLDFPSTFFKSKRIIMVMNPKLDRFEGLVAYRK